MVFLIFCTPLMLYNYNDSRKERHLLINMKLIFILFLISSWMEFFCIWIVKLLKYMDYHIYIPNTLFIIRITELYYKSYHIFNFVGIIGLPNN